LTEPSLSIVLVAHNNLRELASCLPRLLDEPEVCEIIVVDNASTDFTCDWIRASFPSLRVLRSNSNQGYGAGCNRGLSIARGRYILVLNPDTVSKPGSISSMLTVARRHPRSFVTPKLLLPDGRINACGNQMHVSGLVSCTAFGQEATSVSGVTKPLLLSGAAIVASREAWLEVSGFAEWCFMYFEDVDLSLRARALGYDILCAADSPLTHNYRLAMTPQKFFYLHRNRLAVLCAALGYSATARLLPSICLGELMTIAYAFLRGPSYVRSIALSYLWLARNIQSQPRRRISQRTSNLFLKKMSCALPFHQLMEPASCARLLNLLTAPVFQILKSMATS
jgi:GT2 family glycosyltransferase